MSAVLLGLPLAGRATGTVRLDVRAEAAGDLRVIAANTGDESAHEVTPELLYQHETEKGEAVTVEAGQRREWIFTLPPAPGRGIFPATVQVRWTEHGETSSLPAVALVTTAGASASPLRATLDVPPLHHSGSARVLLENPGTRPVGGRVVFVLPDGVTTEPASQPAHVAAGGRAVLPFVLERTGRRLADGDSMYAILTYEVDGEHHTVLARGTISLVAAASDARTRPLLIGVVMLGLAISALVLAWRSTRRASSS